MSHQGPGAAGIVAGIFLILAGLCLVLLGGGCSIFLLSMLGESSGGDYGSMIPLLLLSMLIFGAGLALIWLGVKLMTGGFNKPPSPPPPPVA